MWAAETSERLAYAPGPPFIESATFAFVDLFQPFRDLGAFTTAGPILWSPDGWRAAWCDPDGGGVEMNIPANAIGTLRGCPTAYTTDGEPAYVDGGLLTAGGRTVLKTTGTITRAHWGTDGSVAVIVEGRRIERWEGRMLVHALQLPRRLRADPVLAPDNCAVLVAPDVRDLGCFRGTPKREDLLLGTTAAWSPDGEWIAVAEGRNSVQITFVRVVGGDDVLRWDAGAVELLWRGPPAS
jgi:hypothetical protein